MSEILGIGHDLIEVARIAKVHKEHGIRFLERIFSEGEIDYCLSFKNPYLSLSARFAAKEAASKALGVGIGPLVGWHDLIVSKDSLGKPSLVFSESLANHYPRTKILLTLSHTKEMASAFAIWVKEDEFNAKARETRREREIERSKA